MAESAGRARSYTDLTANRVWLSGTSLRDLDSLLDIGEGPRELLPSFLHEATHHRCFDTPVGNALALLQLRVHRQALLCTLSQEDVDLRLELIRLVRHLESAVAVLQPIWEGLACFAEFDISTLGETSGISTPLRMAAEFFSSLRSRPRVAVGPYVKFSDHAWFSVITWCRAVTHKMRSSRAVVDRKVELLGHPTQSEQGHYLFGYLALKRLWVQSLGHDFLLANETDLFSMYLTSWIFEDWKLVSILLDEGIADHEPRKLYDRVVNRLFALTAGIKQENLSRFGECIELEVEQTDPKYSQLTESIELESAECGAGIEATERSLEELSRPLIEENTTVAPGFIVIPSEVNSWISKHEDSVIKRRKVMHIGSWDVDIFVEDGKYVAKDGSGIIRQGVALPGVPNISGTGIVEVLYWVPAERRACQLLLNGNPIAVELGRGLGAADGTAEASAAAAAELMEVLGERDSALGTLQSLDELTTQACGPFQDILDQDREWNFTEAANLYLSIAFASTTEAQENHLFKSAAEDGLYSLLSYDRQIIEGIVRIGLCCSSLTPRKDFVVKYLTACGIDPDSVFEGAQRVFEETGFRLLAEVDGYVIPMV